MEIYHPKDEELLREMRRVRRSNKRRRLLWGLIIWLTLCVAAGLALYFLYFDVAVVRGVSMGDTLPDGSLVLVRRAPAEGYAAGDLVLYNKEESPTIKRVLAVGGDNVVISPYTRSEIRVNGQYLEEPYIVGSSQDAGISSRRLTVADGELFVAGDQRTFSLDSRSRDYGTIPEADVVGRVDIVLWPLYRLGTITGEDLGSLLAPLSQTGPQETAAPVEEETTEPSPPEGQDAETEAASPTAETTAPAEHDAMESPQVTESEAAASAMETAAPTDQEVTE